MRNGGDARDRRLLTVMIGILAVLTGCGFGCCAAGIQVSESVKICRCNAISTRALGTFARILAKMSVLA
jgi:hypothetical protein